MRGFQALSIAMLALATPVWGCSGGADEAIDSTTDLRIDGDGPRPVRTVVFPSQGSRVSDSAFLGVLAGLREAIARRDASAVLARIDDDFFIERDFGGIYDPEASARENFSSVYALDNTKLRAEYRDSGWRQLERDLSAPFFAKDGRVCGPPEVQVDPPYTENDSDAWLDCFYVDGTDVVLREDASADGATLSTLSHEVIELPRPETTSVDLGRRPAFLEVRRTSGERGFIEEQYVRECTGRRLCFVRDDVEGWKIAGVRLGGD